MMILNKYKPFSKERWNVLLEIKPFRFYFFTNIFFHKSFRLDITTNNLTIWFLGTVRQINKFVGYKKETLEYGEKKIEAGLFIINEDTGNHYQVFEN